MAENRKKEKGKKARDGIVADARFAHLHSDPRFMRIPRKTKKVSIDARFQRMFHDKHFTNSSLVDKRGRNKKQEKNEFHEYYHLSDDDSESEPTSEAEKEQLLSCPKQISGKSKKREIKENDAKLLCEGDSKKNKNKNKSKIAETDVNLHYLHASASSEDRKADNQNAETTDLVKKKKKKKKKEDRNNDFKSSEIDVDSSADGHQNTQATDFKKKKKNVECMDSRFSEIHLDSEDADEHHFHQVQLETIDKKKKKKKNKKVKNSCALEKDQHFRLEGKKDNEIDERQAMLEDSEEGKVEEMDGRFDDDEINDSELSSDSTSESEESETDDLEDFDSPKKEEVPTLDSETRRLAAVNMDWNHVKAVDLLVLMNSFLPRGGQILSVAVYPSEFGLKRMEEESLNGPTVFQNDDDTSEDDDDEVINEKLRQYERDRLRYYFAVIECDSAATADYLYKACDKVEFERTSNVMDLRFIPDDMEFKHPPRDVASEVPSTYEAPDFQTRALQHSKVNLSWDEDEPLRVKTLHRKFDPEKINEMDFKDYLASDDDLCKGTGEDSDDEAEDGEKKNSLREKYRSLLMGSDHSNDEDGDKDDDKDMEITFNTGLEELSKKILEKKKEKEETVWEAYLRKRKEKKRERKRLAKQMAEDQLNSAGSEDISDNENEKHPDDFFMDYDSLDGEGDKSVKSSKQNKPTKPERKKKDVVMEKKHEEDASRAELELLLADDHGGDNAVKGYNLKPKKTKGGKKDLPSEDKLPTLDLDDPRFSALFTSHRFAIDPTDPLFKRSATYSHIIAQRQQRKFQAMKKDETAAALPKESTDEQSSLKKRKSELSYLVKSVKRKVGSLDSKSNM
eukprot:TRINITY_DN1751_c0_g1_i3.p1 TRINITY_DN1751_c0_g1~~TRINITY_DN1751_c0_g1_i3.p1  ORF type:complete len:850 (-),score=262.64 TRINITY_DN1751_c0_g1_i3:130-2679(-)